MLTQLFSGTRSEPQTLVQKTRATYRELQERRSRKRAELSQAEADAAESYLVAVKGGTEVQTANWIATLRSELDLIDRALSPARERHEQALRSAREAEAAELRGQAAEKISKAEQIEAESRDLVEELSNLQGVGFNTEDILSRGTDTPLSQRLRSEARKLQKRAAQLLARPITSEEIENSLSATEAATA